MSGAGDPLGALVALTSAAPGEDRRRLWRRGLTALVEAAALSPAPLEGLDPNLLLASVRLVLADRELDDLGWLSAAAAARVELELAQAIPAGRERRELSRRILSRLREGDRETFVVLATALALTSPHALDPPAVRARLEVVLAAPLSAPGGVGALALALIARPELSDRWLIGPSTRSLPERRLAARLLAHAARAVGERKGDGAELFGKPEIVTAHRRLLSDREILVWRFAAVARGLVAHERPEIAAEIDHELQLGGDAVRRAATSAAAALELGDVALRWRSRLVERSARDGGVARAVIQGLAGLATTDPARADALAAETVAAGGLDAVDALVELMREEGDLALPRARAAALAWLDANGRAGQEPETGELMLARVLRAELTGEAAPGELALAVRSTREQLDGGQLSQAVAHARRGVDVLSVIVSRLERANDEEPTERRQTHAALRELDRDLLADGTLAAALALADAEGAGLKPLADVLERLERTLLLRESEPLADTMDLTQGRRPSWRAGSSIAGPLETPMPPTQGLRLTRLRVLVRLLDGAGGATAPSPASRVPALKALLVRARADHSGLRRAVWAAMTRTWDAMIRGDLFEISDLLLTASTYFPPGESFVVVREATMIPEVEVMLDAYRQLNDASAALHPDDTTGLVRASDRLDDLGKALPRAISPRVEALRDALSSAAQALGTLVRATSLTTTPPALRQLTRALTTVAACSGGARRRVGMPFEGDPQAATARALFELGVAVERSIAGDDDEIELNVRTLERALSIVLPPALTQLVIPALTRVARLPSLNDTQPLVLRNVGLPSWLPMSRSVGGFHILSRIGSGGVGSVFVACRSDDRTRAQPETFALKVPDYGAAAGTMPEHEFEALFRQEAGALLSLPQHPNLAGFITFDARVKPKPILVMELVKGPTLKRLLELGNLDMERVFKILDGLAAGLSAMHGARVAHLDVKPQNVILREGTGDPVLVDFGLAGRQLRPGCGSALYGAPEVWLAPTGPVDPFPADVYALSCIAFELVTRTPLVSGPDVNHVVHMHIEGQAAKRCRRALVNDPALARFGEFLASGLEREPRKRPTIDRLRAGFSRLVDEARLASWPAQPRLG